MLVLDNEMLLELNISNFAIIDRLALRFNPGFNALTGETGAGKSIIIDAMGAMLGEKIGAEFVRHGADRARVEGFFEVKLNLSDERFVRLLELMEKHELFDDAGRPTQLENGEKPRLHLSLCRELSSTGRTICRVNGSTVKQEILREIGQALIDIHGQTEHISLLRVSEHLELLDQYAGVISQRHKLAELVGQLRTLRKETLSLQHDERELVRRTELLRFQVEDIDQVALQPGEEEELLKERQIQNSAEKISTIAERTYRVLYQGYEEEEGSGYTASASRTAKGRGGNTTSKGRSVQEALSEVETLLNELIQYEAEFSKYSETVQEVRYRLEDVAHAVREFRDRVEHDPKRLEEIEERLDLIRVLKRKYGANIAEILKFRKEAAEELDKIEHSSERLAELQTQEAKLLDKIGALAAKLSEARHKSGTKLAAEVVAALQDLKLMRAKFVVNLNRSEDPEGVPVKNEKGEIRRYAFDGRGIDRVEFYVSLNPGEPPKPLQKVASGGETSRLMLALKSILAAADAIPTLIFDEVDVGVGGRSGQVVGEKLWQLTNQAEHQVICITHLPQIAAFGDAHYNIVKQVKDERTSTSVIELMETQRIEELAAMLGGLPVTETKRLNALEMLRDIGEWKDKARAAKDHSPNHNGHITGTIEPISKTQLQFQS
ncbi:MAG: DNA repair protein RecN [Chloroflexota bacterium]